MNKSFSLVFIISMFLFSFHNMAMDFYVIGETDYEAQVNYGINIMIYLSVLKEFSQKQKEKDNLRHHKNNHHIYISSSEDICFKQLIQSEE